MIDFKTQKYINKKGKFALFNFKSKMCLLLALVMALIVFSSCVQPEKIQSKVSIVTPAEGVELYTEAEVFVEQTKLPLYNVKVNNSYRWTPIVVDRQDCGVGYFSLLGKTTVTVNFNYPLDSNTVVRPIASGVDCTIEGNKLTFSISSSGYYSVEPNGDAKKVLLLFVSDFAETDYTQNYTNVIVFEKGVHTAENNQYIDQNHTVTLQDNTIVVLQEGAVVRGKFSANQKSNIAIVGKGIIDGSTFSRNASTGSRLIPLTFDYCKDILISDITFLDPAGWCLNLYFCQDVQIDGVKIISSRSNGDGITLQSCKNVTAKNFFVRSYDDSVVVKNYPKWSDRSQEGQTENISFENGIIWTDLAQSMEIGYETVGQQMENISFSNITVLHNFHKPVMSIHNGNNADVKNVEYKNITVEDASMGGGDAGENFQLIDITVLHSKTWSDQHKVTALGSVSDISFSNIKVLAGNVPSIQMRFFGSVETRTNFQRTTHYVENITLSDIEVYGQKLAQDFDGLYTNSCARNIAIVNTDNAVTGATLVFSLTAEQLANYTDTAEVTVN